MTPDDAAREGLLTNRAAYDARAAEYTELLGTMDAVAEDDRLLVEAWADRVRFSAGDATSALSFEKRRAPPEVESRIVV